MQTILAIETSCDETSAAIARCDRDHAEILSNVVSSQIKLHAEYGGVVPNLAAREHVKNILPVLRQALEEAKVGPSDINAIAVTNGPGLIPALLVGTSAARTLAWLWKKPLLGVHHIEGHIYANAITHSQDQSSKLKVQNQNMEFPLLALVVSGGHTQLILMREHFRYEIVGETQDDAVGEAFDKVARILNLGYPGGPQVDAYAHQFARTVTEKNAEKTRKRVQLQRPRKSASLQRLSARKFDVSIKFPRPMIDSPDFNFSFSGLKTAVLYAVQKMSKKEIKERTPEICKEFQQAAIDVLVTKTIKAAKKYDVKTVTIAGGVSANTELRKQLGISLSKHFPHTVYRIPNTAYSLDNAAMIASAAGIRFARMNKKNRAELCDFWKTLETKSDLQLR